MFYFSSVLLLLRNLYILLSFCFFLHFFILLIYTFSFFFSVCSHENFKVKLSEDICIIINFLFVCFGTSLEFESARIVSFLCFVALEEGDCLLCNRSGERLVSFCDFVVEIWAFDFDGKILRFRVLKASFSTDFLQNFFANSCEETERKANDSPIKKFPKFPQIYNIDPH